MKMIQSKKKTELDGKTWSKYSISVWSDIEKDREDKSLNHPALFPKSLASRLIEIFTNTGDLVLDIFAGSGSTLVASRNNGRRSVGIEISEEYIKLSKSRLAQPTLQFSGNTVHEPIIICDDARNIKKHIEENSVHLCVTSPPYWNILNQKRTADYKETRNYGNMEKDLSYIDDYKEFVKVLGDIFQVVYDVLVIDGYLVVNVMDIRKGPNYYALHMDLATELTGRGYVLDDIIIWDRRRDYNNLRPLGYPYVFRVNKVHEYLLIFQKR